MGYENPAGGVATDTTRVNYMDRDELWLGYEPFVLKLAQAEGVKDVAELGGGANPFVAGDNWDFAQHRVVIDISPGELAKAPNNVEAREADLSRPILDGHNSYDLVFSKMLCEHLHDARTFHQNCFNLLRPGGLSVHFFPTLYTVPFVLNRLMPEKAGASLIKKIQPGRLELGNLDKFPAYYRWCSGPTQRAIKRFESVGFEVEDWSATFGHTYYKVIPPLDSLEQSKTRFLFRHPVPALTSFAVVVLRKPASPSAG
jgi:SAM-dependent methyltransferase